MKTKASTRKPERKMNGADKHSLGNGEWRSTVPRIKLPMTAAYSTKFGAAYVADSRALLAAMPEESVDLAVTSPPYALHFKKAYGNADKQDYIKWFPPFAREIYRALKPDGSFVLNIGGSFNPGTPTRSLYHFKLLIALVEEGAWGAMEQKAPVRGYVGDAGTEADRLRRGLKRWFGGSH